MQYWVWVVVFLVFPTGAYQGQMEDTSPAMRCSPAPSSWVGFFHLFCCQLLLGLGAPCYLPGNPSNTVTQVLVLHKLPLNNLGRGKITQEKKNRCNWVFTGVFSHLQLKKLDLNKWSFSSNSGEAESECKAPVYSAGGSHINHLTSLYKSIMLASAFCRHHALGLHC